MCDIRVFIITCFFLFPLTATATEVGVKVGYLDQLSSNVNSVFIKNNFLGEGMYGYLSYSDSPTTFEQIGSEEAKWNGFSYTEIALGLDIDVYDNVEFHSQIGMSMALDDVTGNTTNGYYIMAGEFEPFIEAGLSYQLSEGLKLTFAGQRWLDRQRWSYLDHLSIKFSWMFGEHNSQPKKCCESVKTTKTSLEKNATPTVLGPVVATVNHIKPSLIPPIQPVQKTILVVTPVKPPKQKVKIIQTALYKVQIASFRVSANVITLQKKAEAVGLELETKLTRSGITVVSIKGFMSLEEANKMKVFVKSSLNISVYIRRKK